MGGGPSIISGYIMSYLPRQNPAAVTKHLVNCVPDISEHRVRSIEFEEHDDYCRNYRIDQAISQHLISYMYKFIPRSMQMPTNPLYNEVPNAWLCRIQREDFETALGSRVCPSDEFLLASPFHPAYPSITWA